MNHSLVRDGVLAPTMSEESLQMDHWISLLLRGGVLLSVVLLVAGTILTFLHHPGYLTSGALTASLKNPSNGHVPSHILDIFALIKNGHGQGIVSLGLLVLIATPVLRVAFSVITFWLEKDRIFVWITSTVLFLLILSLILGKVG